MQFQQETLAKLRARIYNLMRRDQYLAGLVLASPAPTSTTFALQVAKRWPDGTFDGKSVYVVSGTGVGQSAFVDGSAAGTGVITVAPSLGTTLDATSYVEILPDDLTPEATKEALNLALLDLGDSINVEVVKSNPTIDATRRLITVPTNFTKLYEVSYMDTGGIWHVFRPNHNSDILGQEQGLDFTVRNRIVYLSEEIPSDVATATIHISGYRHPALLVAETDLAEAPTPYLVFKAAANLEQALTGNVDVDSEGHGTRGATWMAQAQLHLTDRNYSNFRPNTMILSEAAS